MSTKTNMTLLEAIHESIRESIRKSKAVREEAKKAIETLNSHHI